LICKHTKKTVPKMATTMTRDVNEHDVDTLQFLSLVS
jgi:hypothetical protein